MLLQSAPIVFECIAMIPVSNRFFPCILYYTRTKITVKKCFLLIEGDLHTDLRDASLQESANQVTVESAFRRISILFRLREDAVGFVRAYEQSKRYCNYYDLRKWLPMSVSKKRSVYFAVHKKRHGCAVAVKRILCDSSCDMADILNEINITRTLGRADADRFLPLLDVFAHNRSVYLVSPAAMFGDLHVTAKKLTLPQKLTVCYQLALALKTMHAIGIIHRDVKPENCVITSCDPLTLKIIDFGCSARGRIGYHYTVCGTPGYMSPEMIDGSGYDFCLDFWQYGVTLKSVFAVARNQSTYRCVQHLIESLLTTRALRTTDWGEVTMHKAFKHTGRDQIVAAEAGAEQQWAGAALSDVDMRMKRAVYRSPKSIIGIEFKS